MYIYYVLRSPPPLWRQGVRGERERGGSGGVRGVRGARGGKGESPPPVSTKSLITTYIVVRCPHHLQIEPPLIIHSQNGKRPS